MPGTDLKIGQPLWTPMVTFIFPSRLWTTPFSYTPKWCCNVLYNHPPTSRLGDVSGIATTCHYPQPARPLRSFRAPCHCGRWPWRRVWWTMGKESHSPRLAFLQYFVLIWTKHWKAIGPPQRAITYIFVPGINNWFWRRLKCWAAINWAKSIQVMASPLFLIVDNRACRWVL